MKTIYYFIAIFSISYIFTGCCLFKPCNVFEVDPATLQEKIYEPTATKYVGLQPTTLLYVDHSTCVIDARQNSNVFRVLMGQLGLYSDTLCLIKGRDFEKIPNTNKKPTSTDVYNAINGISQDIPFTNIGQAVENICKSNSQAILITDCEYFDQNGRNQDGFPYLSGSFKEWIKKGHSIYTIVEPYKEKFKGKMFDKKRFYFIFSDDRMEAPISQNILNEVKPLLQDSVCKLYKLTNSDIAIKQNKDMVDSNLAPTVENLQGFDFVEISEDWNSISQFVMAIDENGEAIEGQSALPLLKNIEFTEGEDYIINDIDIVATNITSQYLSKDDNAAANIGLDSKNIKVNNIDMSECFRLDKKALKSHKLNVYLTQKIFDTGKEYITDPNGYGGNLIRLDFVVSKVGLQSNFNYDMFTWQSLWSPDKATCVAKSIENVLHDVEIAPTANDRKIIHTVFLRTEAYK